MLGQDLDGDRPLQPRVPRLVDLSHPARADRGEDLVGTEPGTCRQRHFSSGLLHSISFGIIAPTGGDSATQAVVRIRYRSPSATYKVERIRM